MLQTSTATQKKAEYRLKELIDTIPSGRLIEEKCALAAQMGIGVPQLNRLIRGDNDLSGTQLRIVADFFGRSVDELYVVEEQRMVNDHEAQSGNVGAVKENSQRTVIA